MAPAKKPASYADIEAARVLPEGIAGHEAMLTEAWNRYHTPVALTEVHLGCTREHQMRWLMEAWRGACAAKAGGCDVRAITPWALFGSFGWDTLVTRPPFEYESGAFDVRSGKPRETALARVIRDLTASGDCSHPVAAGPGWWESEDRFVVRSESQPLSASTISRSRRSSGREWPLLITGARGTLGAAYARICSARGIATRALARDELDISNPAAVREALAGIRPWGVVNAAGYVRVDDAEQERASCFRANTIGAGNLAIECARRGIPMLTFSSDLVFDGTKRRPYIESDIVAPLNTYGASKAAAERRALAAHELALIVRTSAFFGPWDDYNFPALALRALTSGVPFEAAGDVIVSPTYVPDLVHASLDLLLDGERGVWHLANRGEIAWSDFAMQVATRAGFARDMIRATSASRIMRPARQPSYTALGSERGLGLPPLENALDRWFSEVSLPELITVTT